MLLIIALLALGSLYPFVHNYIIFGQLKTFASLFFLFLWILIVLQKSKIIYFPSRPFNTIILVQLLFLAFVGVIFEEVSYFSTLFTLLVSWIFVTLFINTFSVKYFIDKFVKINIAMAILCIVGTILFGFGIFKLIGIYTYQGEFYIYNYIFFFIKRTNELTYQVRPGGYYDEPGSFALIVMYLLLLNRKYFHNKKYEYALLILPIITTSLAHIFTILFFVFLFYINKKNTKALIITSFFLISVIFVFSTEYANDNASIRYFKMRTYDRFIGFINGEDDPSRDGGLEIGPEIFEKYPFGLARENVQVKYPNFVNETFWGPIIYYGILGIPFYLLPFIYIGIKSLQKRDKFQLLCLALIGVNLLQRPYYMYPIFIVFIYYLFFHEEKKNFKYYQEKRIVASETSSN